MGPEPPSYTLPGIRLDVIVALLFGWDLGSLVLFFHFSVVFFVRFL